VIFIKIIIFACILNKINLDYKSSLSVNEKCKTYINGRLDHLMSYSGGHVMRTGYSERLESIVTYKP
jgi:hypothetical protein